MVFSEMPQQILDGLALDCNIKNISFLMIKLDYFGDLLTFHLVPTSSQLSNILVTKYLRN